MARNQWNEKLRQKMESYTQSPPDGLWEAVEAGLPQQKAVFPSWVWAFAGVAAALFAVMLIWPKGGGKTISGDDAVAVMKAEDDILPDAASDSYEEAGLQQLPSLPEDSVAPGGVRHGSSANSSAVSVTSLTAVASGELSTSTNDIPAANNEEETEAADNAGETAAPGDKVQDGQVPAGVDPDHAEDKAVQSESTADPAAGGTVLIPLERKKTAYRPNLTASLLAGGIPGKAGDSYTSYGAPGGVRSGTMSLKKAPVALLSRNKATQTDVNHSVALRVGALMQLSFSEHWGLESGLQLSNLETVTRSVTSNMTASAGKTMSYLGVPLHVVYTPFRLGRFALYASAGPMLEYGFRSVSVDESYIGSERVSYDKITRRENDFIWSLEANLGAQWNVGGLGGLFIQPGISWHFAGGDNQESFYTAHPLSFALSAGFRFMF
ncbi:MAG: PorT family protein [Bacteroidales bacterium]|nr:PorT family protein [Bacteroidales bacterium]